MHYVSPISSSGLKGTKRLCFVLMPFKEEYRQVYDFVIKPTIEGTGFECVRADDLKKQRNIMRDVVEYIDKADLIVADLTDANPNVFYELGISHTLAKTTVMITQSVEQFVPFDLRPYRIISYSLDIKGAQKLTSELQATVLNVDTAAPEYSNPVVDFLPKRVQPEEKLTPDGSGTIQSGLNVRRRSALAGESARLRLLTGIDILADAARVTFGPSAERLIVRRGSGSPGVNRDILQLTGDVETGDSVANIAARLLLDTAREQRRTGGESGAKTTIILTQELFRGALERTQTGKISVGQLKSGINNAASVARSKLEAMSLRVSPEQLLPKEMKDAALVRKAFELVGYRGIIDVELSNDDEDTVTTIDGNRFEEGYLSKYFVTNAEREEAILDNPYILFCDEKITSMKALLPILEQVAKVAKPLLIIARDVTDEALATLVVNKLRGTLISVAVRAPGFGSVRAAHLHDLSVLTRGVVLEGESAKKLENAQIGDLGRARKAVITAQDTTIIGPQIDRERNYRNMGNVGRIALIQITGRRESEMLERQANLKRMIGFRTAVEEKGVVAGGGSAFVRCVESVNNAKQNDAGALLLAHALEEPARQLLRNGGYDESSILNEISKKDQNLVFNVSTGMFEDMITSGIMDSTKSLLSAMDNAISLTLLMLTGSIIELQEKTKDTAGEPAKT